MPKECENISEVKDVSCLERVKNLPLHKKVISVAAIIGLILVAIIVLVLVFTAKEGN